MKPKGRKQYVYCFLQYQILKAPKRINQDEYCYHVKQFILVSANSYCHFRILFRYYVLYFQLWTSTLYFPCFLFCFIDQLSVFPFIFYWSHLKAGTVHLSDSSVSRFTPLFIHHSSDPPAPAATAENEEQYNLGNIIYIGFQNSYSSLSSFLWSSVVLKG